MKKLFSILTMLMAFIGIQAQDLAVGQMWWGNYSNQQTSLTGNSKLGTYDVAMFVAGDGDLKGVEIAGARMQTRLYSNAKDVKIWVRSSLDGENLVEKTVENPASSGWCGAKFDAPIALPESGAYVGYSFTLASWYSDYDYTPVVRGSKVVSGGLYLKQPDETTFSDKSATGCATTQIIVSGSNLKTNVASIADDIDDIVALSGTPVKVNVTVTSQGTAGVSSLDYTYTLDGASHDGHIDLETPFGQMFGEQKTFEIELGAPAQLGTQESVIQITKVNGAANENTSVKKTKASVNINVLAESAPRTAVAEIYVGPSKYYSARGLVGAEQLAKTMGDKVIPVVVQSYDSPLVTPEYKAYQQYADGKLRFTSYPQAEINREFTTDPYFGNTTTKPYHFTANTVVEPTLNAVTEGAVSAKATWADEAQTTVKISAKANFTGNFSDAAYRLGFIVIADSIKQDFSNYITYYKGDYPDDDMEFWRNSPYSSKGIAVNNMVVASTDVTGISKSIPSTITAGTDYTYELELPLNQFEGQTPQNFRVVALLLNNDKKTIVNAALAPVKAEGKLTADPKEINLWGFTVDNSYYNTHKAIFHVEAENLDENITYVMKSSGKAKGTTSPRITVATSGLYENRSGNLNVTCSSSKAGEISDVVVIKSGDVEENVTVNVKIASANVTGEGIFDEEDESCRPFSMADLNAIHAVMPQNTTWATEATHEYSMFFPKLRYFQGVVSEIAADAEGKVTFTLVDAEGDAAAVKVVDAQYKEGQEALKAGDKVILSGDFGDVDGELQILTASIEEITAAAADETVTIFKWANVTGADDYVAEAGTIECLGGDKNDRLNYANAALGVNYKTICLNGKKGNLGDGSTNGTYMKVTPTQALKAGDVIAMTAYRNKDAMGKKATAALVFGNGAPDAVIGANPEFPNLNAAGENPTGTPETIELVVTEEMAGAKSINLTRQDASTNLFITSLIITSASEDEVVPVESVSILDPGNEVADGQTFTFENLGESYQFTAVVTPENATNKNVTWEVLQDSEVVTCEEGLVTLVGYGKAAVVVTTEDGEKQAYVNIFVQEKEPEKEPTTFEITNDGLDVTITPSNDNEYGYAVLVPELVDFAADQLGTSDPTEIYEALLNMFNLSATGEITFNAMEDYLEYVGLEELEPGTEVKVLVSEVKKEELDGEKVLVRDGEITTYTFTYGEGAGETDNVEWDPAPGEIDYNSFGGHLDQVILTFTDAGMVEVNDIPFKANIEDETGREVDSMYGVNFYFLGMNQACITFNKGVTADGTYTVNVPAGLFTLTMPDGTTKASSELHATYIVTGAGDAPVAGGKMQILPAEGNVTSLQQFTLVINDWDSQFDNYNSKAQFYKDGELVEEVEFDYDPENWTDPNLYGSLSAPVTADGTYTLEFPVGSMTTNSWATSNTEPVVYTWTIGEGGGEEELPIGTYAAPIALEDGKTYGLNAAVTGAPNFYTFESDKDVKIILTPTEGSIVEGGFAVSTGNFLMDDQYNDLEGAEMIETMMEPVEGGSEPGIGGDDDELGGDFGWGMAPGRMATTWTAKAGVKYYIMTMGQGAFDVALGEPEEYVGTIDTPINLNETPEWTWGVDGKLPGNTTYYTYTAEKDGNLTIFVSNCAENQLYVGEGGWYDSYVHTEGPAYTGEIKTDYNWDAWSETNTFAVEAGTTYFITIFDLYDETIKATFEEATGIKGAAADKANGTIFNVGGQKVDKTAKGILIINGKKVLKK